MAEMPAFEKIGISAYRPPKTKDPVRITDWVWSPPVQGALRCDQTSGDVEQLRRRLTDDAMAILLIAHQLFEP